MSQALEWIVFPTLYGWVGVARSVAGMWGLTLPVENAEVARESIIKLLKGFRGEIREVALPGQPWESIITSIQSYFRGEEISFQFPLDLFGYTLFQRKVLLATAKIP
ncbi:MAG: hypothetical protein H5U03_03035, partial [Clostridia bacterium]|nr:hypothetical protein [Clostridia bacterium]